MRQAPPSDDALALMSRAGAHASAAGSRVTPEHVMRAIVESQGLGGAVLAEIAVDWAAIEGLSMRARESACDEPGHGASARTERVLDFAQQEAASLGCSYVGEEHLLLGVLLEDGAASQLLRSRGIGYSAARKALKRLTGIVAPRPALCPDCRYDLRASEERCPECGRQVEAPDAENAENDMSTVEKALAGLRGLGTVDELRAAARSGHAPSSRPRVNAHIHLPPNFSAFESVKQAVDLAKSQGVSVLGVSNYYDYDVYGDFVGLAKQAGIFPLFGLEIIALINPLVKAGVKINDPGNPGKIYICGKGITKIDPFSAEAMKLLSLIRLNDSNRMAAMVVRLNEVFASRGVDLKMTDARVIDMVVRRHGSRREIVYLQERHICQAFQEALFERISASARLETLTKLLGAAPKSLDPVTVQNDIRAHLMKAGKPAYIDETFVNFEQAVRLILELDGIPCYPTLADGTKPICGYEEPVDKLIENIKKTGLHMAEFIPIRNSPEVLSQYVKAMRAAGLAITAGTEHNTLDLLPIEPTCVKGAAVPEDVKEIFWEGACVVAAHQFLTLHGECGFVDDQGKPNPAYASAEDRIQAFAELGAAVIECYLMTSR